MFTGIITDVGKVISFEKLGSTWRLCLKTNFNVSEIDIGASVACNGVCLTVVEKLPNQLSFDLSPETVNLTGFLNAEKGDSINLERSLKVGDELGGHYVSGHVDGLADVIEILDDEGNWVVEFSAESSLSKYIAKKGSVTINGTSLTVNKVEGNNFFVNIIPHSLQNTNLSEMRKGDSVNLEVDIFARYIERISASS